MVGEQDAEVVDLGEVSDRVLDLADRLGVDARERLVEQDQLRLGDEGAGDLEAAALAAGDPVGLGLADVVRPNWLEQLVLTELLGPCGSGPCGSPGSPSGCPRRTTA